MARATSRSDWQLRIGVRWRLLWLVTAVAVLGVGAAVIWSMASYRPGYLVTENLTAVQSEEALAGVFAADALFTLLTAIAGLLIGVLAWLWFRDVGWWLFVLTLGSAGLLGIVCWQLGLALSPADFHDRLVSASPGDVVPIDLALNAWSALLVGPFFSVIPLMVFSAVWPEARAELGTARVAADAENM